MPNVTVAGAGGATVTLSFDSNANATLAQSLAGAITQGVLAGTIATATSKAGPPPVVPAGKTGEWVQEANGATFLPAGYAAIVSSAQKATIFGTGEANASVLASGGLTFHSAGGSGTVVAGGGENRIHVPAGTTGAWSINTGDGNDSIQALGTGDDTIRAGGGRNVIQLDGGNDQVIAEGKHDRIVLGGGSATIVAAAGGKQEVFGGSADLFFVGGEGAATIFGGTGSMTIHGGDGTSYLHGGRGGNNVIYGGTGKATLQGAGNGDQLYAGGDKAQELFAGPGAATLFGALAGGDNTFHAGPGATMITGGFGDDLFVGGLGDSTITGGPGADTYRFIKGISGGNDLVYGFDADDRIQLAGYGKNAVQDALDSQSSVAGGVQITLSDSTTVTFMGLSLLTKSSFDGG